jgi:HSP20 family protein
MTVTTGWDLFEDLRAAQDEMLQAARSRQLGCESGSPAVWVPPIDISEGEDAYLVAVELPGVRPGLVEITVEGTVLTVQGERHFAHDSAAEKMHLTERHYGPFRRSITLPSHIDADGIEASAQDGVLHILIPKVPGVPAKHIQVNVGQRRAVPAQGATVNDAS